MHAAALSIFSVGARLWGEALPRQPANFPNRSAAASRKHWVEADDQDQWLYKTDSFIKRRGFAWQIPGEHLAQSVPLWGGSPFAFLDCWGPASQITPGNASRFHFYGEWNCTRGWRPLPAQCKKILFIKMLIRSTLFPINQIKWPQQFQPFLCLERPGNGFSFAFAFLFSNVAQVMMVFGVSLPSHKSQRRQINSSLQKKIHQGAIDFINCSGESLTSLLFHKCAFGTKVGAMIWRNLFFCMNVIFQKLLGEPL